VFDGAEILFSNLGGLGPDTPAGASAGAHGIRYVNVGSIVTPYGPANIDLLTTNQSAYSPFDSSLNTLEGKFANVNVACNSHVWLRVTTLMSCSSGPSCKLCDDASLSAAMRTACYAAGCSCFGATVYSQGDCTGASKAAKHASYSCPLMHMPIIAPSGSLVSMTVYDFDTGPASNVVETLHVPDYEYYKTPLRATSDASIASSIAVNETARTFTATASGSSADNPTDPTRRSVLLRAPSRVRGRALRRHIAHGKQLHGSQLALCWRQRTLRSTSSIAALLASIAATAFASALSATAAVTTIAAATFSAAFFTATCATTIGSRAAVHECNQPARVTDTTSPAPCISAALGNRRAGWYACRRRRAAPRDH
jgi:hypothetical protein